MTPAGKLQKYLREQIEALGGEYRKVQWEGRVGCPDCYVWLPGGRYAWIEIKAGRDLLSKLQDMEVERMLKAGLCVCVVRDAAGIDFIVDILRTGTVPGSWDL